MKRSQRVGDLKILDELLEDHADELNESETEAFRDMRVRLTKTSTPSTFEQWQLTDKQRDWVRKRLGDFKPAYENLVSSGKVSSIVKHNHSALANCTANCPGWTPPSLQNLPLKPPQKRT